MCIFARYFESLTRQMTNMTTWRLWLQSSCTFFIYSVYTWIQSDPFVTHFWFVSVFISSSRSQKKESKYFFVFVIPRWRMVHEMKNPFNVIFEILFFFFLIWKVFLLRFSKLKRKRLKIELLHSFQLLKQMKEEQ